ncbi:MAG: hypothetical protein JRJ66_01515 [Deltaproteobacteria bacterium]|nr:hypothetical protein [Deltaproteobacteria bacterium]MBW2081676.1 hypothetical protein [Deltaproteobacteria bacterium]MBW2298871.1 hypothetical protein [Deltaproteobacteria bacterium]
MIPQVALIAVSCLFSALVGFAIFYLREIRSSFRARLEKLEDRFEGLPEKYVFRDDFIRWTIAIDKKIDDVAKDVKKLIEGMACQQ